MEREVGGGIGMGNTCKPMAVSSQCMTKFTTNKKINKINKIERDLKKKKDCKYKHLRNGQVCLSNNISGKRNHEFSFVSVQFS